MSENTLKINAIVVQASQSGENDKILTLLSPKAGKISVIAKGIRSLKHQSRNACGFLCYSSFVLKKIKDGFYSLVSAELSESFRTLSEDVVLLSYGAYFADLTRMCVQSGVEASEEVRLLLNTLYVLCKKPHNAPLIKAVFEFKIMELCGIVPDFSPRCPCGNDAAYFCVSEGEIRCGEHKGPNAIPINAPQIKICMYLLESNLRDALFCEYDEKISVSLSALTEPFLAYHLGNLPNSLTYLHQIVKKIP